MGATRQTALQVARAAGSDQAASLLIKAGARSFRLDSDSDSDAAGSDDDSDDVPKIMMSASEPAPQGKAVAAGTTPPPASRPHLLKSLSKYSSRVEVAPEELPPVSPQSASVPSTPASPASNLLQSRSFINTNALGGISSSRTVNSGDVGSPKATRAGSKRAVSFAAR